MINNEDLDRAISERRLQYKKIAEFMEYGYIPSNSEESKKHTPGWYMIKNLDNVHDKRIGQIYLGRKTDDLAFKYSWNMLMNVIIKIERSESQKFGKFKVSITDDCCTIQATNRTKENTYSKTYCSENKLNSTYQSVLLFLDWYNTIK